MVCEAVGIILAGLSLLRKKSGAVVYHDSWNTINAELDKESIRRRYVQSCLAFVFRGQFALNEDEFVAGWVNLSKVDVLVVRNDIDPIKKVVTKTSLFQKVV